MGDRLETAPTGRARCRACGTSIDKGALRFGEEVANAYGEDQATSVYWFHPPCAALRRPEKLLPLARDGEAAAALPDRDTLIGDAQRGAAHPRLARLDGVERAASGRARCRQCREPIPNGAWRFRLSEFADTGFFEPLGFIHTGCAPAYFETPDFAEQVRRVARELDEAALAQVLGP
jgi:hypothetical protein